MGSSGAYVTIGRLDLRFIRAVIEKITARFCENGVNNCVFPAYGSNVNCKSCDNGLIIAAYFPEEQRIGSCPFLNARGVGNQRNDLEAQSLGLRPPKSRHQRGAQPPVVLLLKPGAPTCQTTLLQMPRATERRELRLAPESDREWCRLRKAIR
jgi:hypothetical protein